MAKTYLSGNGPDESEPLTESQINDARRPSSMAMSSQIMDEANDDETPAIERRNSHDNLISFSEHIGDRKLSANPEFEAAELQRREAEKEAKRKAEAERRKTKTEKSKVEESAQSSPKSNKNAEEPEKKTKKEDFDFSLLYPTADKTTDNSEKPSEIGRAKFDEKCDDQSHRLFTSFALQVVSIITFLVPSFSVIPKYLDFLNVIIYIFSVISMIAAAVILFYDVKTKTYIKYPFSQRKQLIWASIIPFLILRAVAIIALDAIIPSMILDLDQVLATAGVGVAGYYQYMLLQKNKIPYSINLTAINTFVTSAIVVTISALSGRILYEITSLSLFVIFFFLFDKFCGDMTKTIVYWRKQFSPKSQW